MIPKKLHSYISLMRLDKPIGIFLLLWPTLMGLWIAGNGHPSVKNTVIFVLGVIIMRSAGCVINDLADMQIDKYIVRTRLRPLVIGRITPFEARCLFLSLVSTAFVLVLFLNTYTILLSLVAVILSIIYPFMKRYTHWPQAVLGIAFAWAIPMAFSAEINTIPIQAYLLFFITSLWALVYDTEYALADRKDDLQIGVKSTAILFGDHDRLFIGLTQALIIVLFILLGVSLNFSSLYFIAVSLSTVFFIYQQDLIKDRDPGKCLQAFRNNHYLGAFLFLSIFLEYL